MNNINKAKQNERIRIMRQLEALSEDKRRDFSRVIADKLFSRQEYKSAKNVFIYLSTALEVDTDSVIRQMLIDGKNISIPLTQNDNMTAIEYSDNVVLTIGKYGIREPKQGKVVDADAIDLVVVPLVGFDEQANRLGHGKGYYDRFLTKTAATKIGIAFEVQKAESLPHDEYDVRMDIIISEKGIYESN